MHQGAETSIFLASSSSVEGITGKYWTDCEMKTSSGESYGREVKDSAFVVPKGSAV
jgi:hypothetical protein